MTKTQTQYFDFDGDGTDDYAVEMDFSGVNSQLNYAASQGIIFVVSAGNGYYSDGNPIDTDTVWPACNENCIVVGAIDPQGEITSFSNYGNAVDVVAPGLYVRSNIPAGTSENDPSAILEEKHGTSMSAPHIAALAAMVKMANPGRTPAQIEEYIKDYCLALGDPEHYGNGLPIAALFAESAEDQAELPAATPPPTETPLHEDEDNLDEEPTDEELPTDEEIDDRLEEEGAEAGEIEFTLAWETSDDLDLHCLTPAGNEISWKNRSADGGSLDIDANAGRIMEHPVEHITFPAPELGDYKIWVVLYKDRNYRSDTPAVVRVKFGDTEQRFEITLRNNKQKIEIGTFSNPLDS